MTEMRVRAVQLYDLYTHEHRDRRRLLAEMAALAGSVAAAEGLIAAIGASPAAAAIVPPDDPRIVTHTSRDPAAGSPSIAYSAAPRSRGGRTAPAVLVIHENRGLNDHIRDVARRLALAGFRAVAPDFLGPQGGTPVDQDRAREMIGGLDYDLALRQAQAIMADVSADQERYKKVGAVGFCWGGAFVNRLAVAAGPALGAGVSYYGPAPAPSEAARVRAPLLIQLAGKDARVAQTAEPWIAALRAAGRSLEAFTYPGVDHAFNNDTSAERYNKPAATQAWARTTAFLRRHLKG